MKKAVTSPIPGECEVLWFNPASGDLIGCPPLGPWIRESVVYASSRRGPIKTGSRVIAYGWTILDDKSQRRNLSSGVFLRRLFWRKVGDSHPGAPVPPNAVDPKTIKPGKPGVPYYGAGQPLVKNDD